MEYIITIVSIFCVLLASMTLGNWFLSEMRRVRSEHKPWYAAYLSLPGLVILGIVLLLPVMVRLFNS